MGELDEDNTLIAHLEFVAGGTTQVNAERSEPRVTLYTEVRLTPKDQEGEEYRSGSHMWLYLTPDEAAVLGDQLIQAAKFAEGERVRMPATDVPVLKG